METSAPYAVWLQEHLPHRSEQKAYIEDLQQNDPRFQGLSFEDTAKVAAEASGFKPFNRFAAGGFNRFFDYVGSNLTQAMNEAAPSDYGLGGDYTYGQYIGGGLKNVSRAFGASEDTAQAFYEGGLQMPAMIGAIAAGTAGTMLGGPVGLGITASMLGTMYGQGLDQAYSQGVTDWRATAVGALGPATMLATMGTARPLSNIAGQKALSWMGGEAAKDLTKFTGSEAVKIFTKESAASGMTKALVRTAQEGAVQAAGSAMGIASAVGGQLLIDPVAFVSQQMYDKHFWIPTLIGETFSAAGGTLMGRIKDPIGTPDAIRARYAAKDAEAVTKTGTDAMVSVRDKAEQAMVKGAEDQLLPESAKEVKATEGEAKVDASIVELTPEQKAQVKQKGYVTDPNKPLVKKDVTGSEAKKSGAKVATPEEAAANAQAEQIKINNGVLDPTTKAMNEIDAGPNSDAQLVGKDVGTTAANARQIVQTNNELSGGTHVAGDFVAPVIPKVIDSPQQLIGTIADTIATGDVDPHANMLGKAQDVLNAAIEESHPALDPEDVKRATLHKLQLQNSVAGKDTHGHFFPTAKGKVYFYNPGTSHVGVFSELIRNGKSVGKQRVDGQVGSGTIFTISDVVRMGALDDATLQRVLAEHYGVPLELDEYAHLSNFIRRASTEARSLPFGASFSKDIRDADPKFASGMLEILYQSGIQQALQKANVRLRFAGSAQKLTVSHAETSPFDYFSSKNEARFFHTPLENGEHVFTISRNPGFSNYSDLHELGHAVHKLIELGAFDRPGEEGAIKAELDQWLAMAVKQGEKSTSAQLGAEMARELMGKDIVNLAGVVVDPAPDAKLSLASDAKNRERYATNPNEIVAQTVMGVLGDKSKPWYSLIEKHFPRLNHFLQRMLAPFYKDRKRGLDQFSPGYKQGYDLLSGILNARYAESKEMSLRFHKVVESTPLHPRVVESLVHAWYRKPSRERHDALEGLVNTWKKFEVEGPDEQIQQIGSTMQFGEETHGLMHLNPDGTLNTSQVFITMPWINSIVQGANNMLNRIVDTAPLEKGKGTNKTFLRPDSELEQIITKVAATNPERAQSIRDYLRGRELIGTHWERLNAVVDVAFGHKYAVDRPQTDLPTIIRQLYALDSVIKKWALGRLDYQKGRPMYEPTWSDLAKGKETGAKVARNPNEQKMTAEYAYESARRWFPQLSKELRKAVSSYAHARTSELDTNGNFAFADKSEKRTIRSLKTFSSKEEAQKYIDGISKDIRYAMVTLAPWRSPKISVTETTVTGTGGKVKQTAQQKWYVRAKEAQRTSIDYTSELDRYNLSRQLVEDSENIQTARNLANDLGVDDDTANVMISADAEKAAADLAAQAARVPTTAGLQENTPLKPLSRPVLDYMSPAARARYTSGLATRGHYLFNKYRDVIPPQVREIVHEVALGLHDPSRFTDENGQRLVKVITDTKATLEKHPLIANGLRELFGLKKMEGVDGAKTAAELAEKWVLTVATQTKKGGTVEAGVKNVSQLNTMMKNRLISMTSDLVEGEGATLKDFYQSMSALGGDLFLNEVKISMDGEGKGKLPFIDPSEMGREESHGFMAPTEDATTAANLTRAHSVGPGNMRNQMSLGVSKRVVKALGYAPFGAGQKIHKYLGQGPLHWAAQNPYFGWAMKALYDEHVNPTAMAAKALTHKIGSGQMVERADGVKYWELDKTNNTDDAAYKKVMSTPHLDDANQRIMRVEQIGGERWEVLAEKKFPMDEGSQTIKREVDEIKKLIKTPEEAEVLQEVIARRYGAQLSSVKDEVGQSVTNLVNHFALAISKDPKFDGSAQAAKEFAVKFHDMSPTDRVTFLVEGLGKEPPQAVEIVKSFGIAYKAMIDHSAMLNSRPEYVPFARYKDFHVRVQFKGLKGTAGKGYYDFNSAPEANAFVAKMRAQGHQAQAPVDFTRAKSMYRKMPGTYEEALTDIASSRATMISMLLDNVQMDAGEKQEIVNMVSDIPIDTVLTNEAVKVNKVTNAKRNFTKGYEEMDMEEQHIQGIRRRVIALSRKDTDLTFKLFAGDKHTLEDMPLYGKLQEFVAGMRLPDSEYQKKVGMIGYSMCMLANPSSGIIEVAQGPMTLVPKLLEMGASLQDAFFEPTRVAKDVFRRSMSRLASMGKGENVKEIWVGDELEFIKDCETKGRVNQTKHHEISQSDPQKLLNHYRTFNDSATWGDRVRHMGHDTFDALNKFYGAFNRFNAEISLMSTYRLLKKQGMPFKTTEQKQAIFNKAMMISDMANGSLQKLGRFELFNHESKAMRNAASTYWSLQSFVNAQIANQLLYVNKSFNVDGKWTPAEVKQARKATAALLGMQSLALGTAGFTLIPSLTKLIKTATGYDPDEEMREFFLEKAPGDEASRKFMADFAQYGLAYAAGFPLDYGPRMSISGVGPLSAYEGFDSKQLGGPVVGLAAQAMRDLYKYKTGTIDGPEVALNVLPLGIRRLIRMHAFDNGQVYDGNKKKMFTPTAFQQLGMGLGFNTVQARKHMEAIAQQKEGVMGDTRFKLTQANAVIEAERRGDMATVQKLIQQTSDQLGLDDTNDYIKFVAAHKTSQLLGQDVRQGQGPNAQRAARLYPLPTQVGHLERKQTEDTFTRMLGGRVTSSPKTYLRAHALDMLIQNNPGLTSGAASKLWDSPRTRSTIYDMLDPNVATSAFQSAVGLGPSLAQPRQF